jgi:hypothetical protein
MIRAKRPVTEESRPSPTTGPRQRRSLPAILPGELLAQEDAGGTHYAAKRNCGGAEAAQASIREACAGAAGKRELPALVAPSLSMVRGLAECPGDGGSPQRGLEPLEATMDPVWRLEFMDGREIAARSPASFFEALRQDEPNVPADLGRYLDQLRSRGSLGFGVDLDVGHPGAEINDRCTHALSSLIAHGWVRLSTRCVAPCAAPEEEGAMATESLCLSP